MSFKVGDRVERITSSNTITKDGKLLGMVPGDTGTIDKVGGYRVHVTKDGETESLGTNPLCLKLATESVLEKLVAQVNAGFAALEKLKGHEREIEYQNPAISDETWKDISQSRIEAPTERISETRKEVTCVTRRYRVKPKVIFDNFTTSCGNEVSLSGDTLKIGCQNFSAKLAKQSLIHLLKHNAASTDNFRSTRKGITYRAYLLTWEDAEKLLKALEKAGVS